MEFLRAVVPDRPSRLLLMLLSLGAFFCTRIPLFNYLGFEFSALTALTAGYASGLYVLLARTNDEAKRGFALFRSTLIPSLFFLIPPLVIISLNALLIKNCSFADGLMFYLLLPVPAVLFTNSLAVFIASVTARWRKLWYSVTYLVILSHILIVTFAGPQIFAFNPILGFFPGITYDESLEIGMRLLVYRASTVVAALLLVLLASVFRNRNHAGPREFVTGLAGFAVLAAMFVSSEHLGHSSSERFIRNTLGGEITTRHFVIYYPKEHLSPRQVAELADLHEFTISVVSRELRTVPDRKIRSFVYAGREQKGRLIGASGTNIAKPWLRQLHINYESVPSVLKHELVHVVAADFGFPLLRIGLNAGLIEGLAVAVERVEYDETVHRLAAQILANGIMPDMESLFSWTGFLRSHGGTSYVLAGSFTRYLIDHYGIRRFKRLYRTGSFESFYDKDLSTLLAEWGRFIAEPRPSAYEAAKAAYLFRRPSIFGKECARVIAGINTGTREALRNGRWEDARESSRRSLELTGSPEAILQHAAALVRLRQYSDVIAFATGKLHDSTVAHALLPLRLSLGDSYWATGEREQAKGQYESLYLHHLSLGWDEAAMVRLEALKQDSRLPFVEFFTTEMNDSARIGWLEARRGEHLLVEFLLGREYFVRGEYEAALRVLTRLPALNSGVLEYLRFRRVARSYFEIADYQRAKMYFWESLNFTSKPSHQIETTEWLERCDWMEGKKEE